MNCRERFSFDEVEGNEGVKSNLLNAINAERISHCYIFSGEKGLGKKLIAKCFAKALQCQERDGAEACGECAPCKTFVSGNSPDVFFVSPQHTKSIGVDDVREKINARMRTRPYSGRYKIFIVSAADKMTVAAQNALLRTIEEPASYGVFLLLCENHRLMLPTVLSRCVILKMRSVPKERAAARLSALTGADCEKAALYSGYAVGNIGRAVTLMNDDEFSHMREAASLFASGINDLDELGLFKAAAAFEPFKERAAEALDIFYLWFRDAAAFKQTGKQDILINSDMADKISSCAAQCSMTKILRVCDSLLKAKRRLAQNASFQMVIDAMLISVIEA
ncbi:MAG: hypothetical protein LBL35_02695 [Clostridiales bacterium]|jgi:DNA polymerase-3 subunit delta'|nr:hypothetical protein [Clostridiales bacterium]